MSDSPVSPEDIRAAAETYRELGPEYHDAVVASFLEKIEREVAARVDARLDAHLAAAQPAPRRRRALTKRRARDLAAAGAGALAVVGVVAAVGIQHSGSPVRSWQVRAVPAVPGGPGQVIVGPNGKSVVVLPAPQAPGAPKPAAP
jgi:ferric-dicitrate binding protein FerR (iron transport regulator)